jgi:hypothetical protein
LLVGGRVLTVALGAPTVGLVVAAIGLAPGDGRTTERAARAVPPASRRCTLRPSLYRIDLTATERAPGAKGVARLRPAATPFGLPVTVDGHVVWAAEVTGEGLPAPATLGAYTVFVAWAATPDLDAVRRLGALANGSATGEVAWNKFLIFVSAEASATADRWSGPIVLRGMSASGYMQNFSAHPLFNGGVPPC